MLLPRFQQVPQIYIFIKPSPSASIPQNQREAPLPAGLSRWRSGIAVGHVTEGSSVRFPLETSFFPKKFFRYYKPPLYRYILNLLPCQKDAGVYIYTYIYDDRLGVKHGVTDVLEF